MFTAVEHPDIGAIQRFGFPLWARPKLFHCDKCGQEIEGDVYWDYDYENLCETCLLRLHRKG